MTLDFPTFERPRNAISGNCGAGKCATSLAAIINRVNIRMAESCLSWSALKLIRVHAQSPRGRFGECTSSSLIGRYLCHRYRIPATASPISTLTPKNSRYAGNPISSTATTATAAINPVVPRNVKPERGFVSRESVEMPGDCSKFVRQEAWGNRYVTVEDHRKQKARFRRPSYR